LYVLCFVPTCHFWVASVFLSSINPSPGAARQPLTFFVSPKKVSKETRPRDPAPFGGARRCEAKNGKEKNSLRSDSFSFFFHFSHRSTGWLQAELPDWLAAPRHGVLASGFVIPTFCRHHLIRRPSARWDPVTSVRHSPLFTTLGSSVRWNDEAKETR